MCVYVMGVCMCVCMCVCVCVLYCLSILLNVLQPLNLISTFLLRQVGAFLRVLRFLLPIKTGPNDKTEILLKVALNTITP
jgi:hypothetical protein